VKFFLNLDDRFGALQLLFQALDLVLELSVFECKRIGLDTALFGGESLPDAVGALTTPRGEMRRVQSFPPNQCAPLRRRHTGIGFVQDPLLVFGGELAMLGFWPDLGVR
jgi:hypothetical protein